jgi:hypothetical protein
MDKPKKVFTREEKYIFLLGQDQGMNYEQIQQNFKLEGTMEELGELGTELFDVDSSTFDLYEQTIAAGGIWTENGPFFPLLQNPSNDSVNQKRMAIANLYRDLTRLREGSPNAVLALQDALNRVSTGTTPSLPIVATPLAMAIMMRDQESTQLHGPQNAVWRPPSPFRRPENPPVQPAMAASPASQSMAASPGHPDMPPPPTEKQKVLQTVTAPEPPSLKRKAQDAPSTPEPSAKKQKQKEPEWTMQEIVDLEIAFYQKVPYEVIFKKMFPYRSYKSIQMKADDINRRVAEIKAAKEQQRVQAVNVAKEQQRTQAVNASREQAMNAAKVAAMNAARVQTMNAAKEQQNRNSANPGFVASPNLENVVPPSLVMNDRRHHATLRRNDISGVPRVEEVAVPPAVVANSRQHNVACPGCCASCCWAIGCGEVAVPPAFVANKRHHDVACPGCCADCCWAIGCVQAADLGPPSIVAKSVQRDVACSGCCASCCWAKGCVRAANHRENAKVSGLPKGAGSM